MDIIARILNFSLMIAMPLVLAVYLVRKLNAEWRLFGIGVVTFIGSQVFHIPFNLWVLNSAIEKLGLSITQQGLRLVAVALFHGLSAGIFEEVACYIGYLLWLKDNRDWKSALMFGAGHGGVEAIILGVLALYALILLTSLRGTDLSAVVDAENIELACTQIETYWDTPWYLVILGAVEWLVAICFHLSAAVLVLQSFWRKNIVWLAMAIGWHTLLNAVAVFAAQTWNPYITEGILVVMGILSVGIIFRLKSTDQPEGGETPPLTLITPKFQPVDPSTESLEDSRYV